jgi:rare lipoprotein A
MIKKILIIIIGFILLSGCAGAIHVAPPKACTNCPPPYKVFGKWYKPIAKASAKGFKQRGIASWYGKKFHGRKTSNGEIYDMYKMTAAHKTLPLGSIVKVKNLNNNKEIIVRINDRGPFIAKRIIDLSYTGAKRLDIVGPGTAPVEISVLSSIKNNKKHIKTGKKDKEIMVQIGAFANLENARAQKAFLLKKYKQSVIITKSVQKSKVYYKVKAVGFRTLTEADRYALKLMESGFKGVFISVR